MVQLPNSWKPGDPAAALDAGRPNRRQLLRSGARTLAGLTALAGTESLLPSAALAQSDAAQQTLVLNSVYASPVINTLVLCSFSYGFQMELSTPSAPADIPNIYRLILGSSAPGPAGDRLSPIFLPEPDDPKAFPPAPAPPVQWQVVNIYRTLEPLTQTLYQITDRCILYLLQDEFMLISTGWESISFRPPGSGVAPCFADDDKTPVLSGRLNGAAWQKGTDTKSDGSVDYWVTDDDRTAAAEWTFTCAHKLTQAYLSTYIPSVSKALTQHARYEISNASRRDNPHVVVINQDAGKGQTVPLGTVIWNIGTYKIRLTYDGGKPDASLAASRIDLSGCY